MSNTFKRALDYISELQKMNSEQKKSFEKKYGVSHDHELTKFRNACYDIQHLRISHMKTLRNELNKMCENELKIVEEINNMTLPEIHEYLDALIQEQQEETRKKRSFSRAWKVKKQEVLKQLVEEGVMEQQGKGLSSYYHGDFVTIMRRLDNARAELANEMNVSTY